MDEGARLQIWMDENPLARITTENPLKRVTTNMPPNGKKTEGPGGWVLLRASDQVAVASCLAVALAAMAAWWFVHGGHRGELIEIDRAAPLDPQFLVDVNEAEWQELTLLPEIGETLARRIVASREAKGPFLDNRDLMRVNGIGPRTLERIQPYLIPVPDASSVAGW